MPSKWIESDEELLEEEQIPVTGAGADVVNFVKQWGQDLPVPRALPWRVIAVLALVSLLIAVSGWAIAEAVKAGWLQVERWTGLGEPSSLSIGFWILSGLVAGFIVIGACRLFGACGRDRSS